MFASRPAIDAPQRASGTNDEEGAVTLSLIRALEANDRFRRDSRIGSIFHPGRISFRELSPTDSVHIIIDGNQVSAHVDEVCPLRCRPGGVPGYSLVLVLAHNLSGLIADLGRRLHGLHGQQRCNLGCEVVWVDDDEVAVLGTDVDECKSSGPIAGDVEVPMSTLLRVATDPLVDQEYAIGDEIPFSLIDEAVQLLDDDRAPWSIQLEVRVAGRLDERRLREGIRRALNAHPMARARRVAAGRWASRDRWFFGPTPEGVLLQVVECADDDQLAATRAELQSLRLPLITSPPVRAWLARHPDGDVLMLNVHHAAMDALGALRVLRSIARGYAGEPDPAATVDFHEARHLPASLVHAGLATRLRRALALVERLGDLVAPPARIARDGGTSRPGYGFQTRVLPTAATDALLATEHPATVNDVLLAALHLTIAAWNAEHGIGCGRIGVLVPANLRPEGWREDVAGNFALPARVSTGRRSRRSRGAVIASITAQTGRKKRSGIGTAYLEVLGPSGRLPVWVKQVAIRHSPFAGSRMVDTSMFSNLGLVSEPVDFGGEAGSATEMWFSPPARMPLGVSIGALTLGGRLHLVFRHRHQQFGDDAGRRFADRYMTELGHLSTRLDPRRRPRRLGGYGLGGPPPVYPAYRSPVRRSLAARRTAR